MRRLLTLPIACLLTNCAMFVWRPAALVPELSWIEGDEFAEILVSYEEKQPLDPLAGTTLKRNYRCEIRRVRMPGRAAKGADIRFSGWCDPASVYAWRDGTLLMRGPEHEFAGSERELVYLPPGKEPRILAKTEPGRVLRAAVPAPDRQWILVLTGDAQAGAYFLRLVDGKRIPIIRQELPEEWIWRKDSSGVFLRYPGGAVFQVGVADGRPEPATKAPAGFTPPTRGGGPVSGTGKRYYFDEASGQFTAEQDASYKSFDDVSL